MAASRNIGLKKIENRTRCQVTYSKRRTTLIEMAREMSICCDVDVIVVTFSSADRVTMFCNHKRVEDVLGRYINSSSYQRYNDIKNVERKLQRLEQMSHINGDYSKMQFLDNKIENLQLHIRKREMELQIAEQTLENYEINPNDSLDRLSSCEKNLKISLQKVVARRENLLQKEKSMELQNQLPQATYSSTLTRNAQLSNAVYPFDEKALTEHSRTSPHMVHENIFQDMSNQGNQSTNFNPGPSNTPKFSIQWNTSNFPMQESLNPSMTLNVQVPPTYIPLEHPSMSVETLINDTSSVDFPNEAHKSTQSFCNNSQDPSLIINANQANNNLGVEDYDIITDSEMYYINGLSQNNVNVHPHYSGDLPPQNANEDEAVKISNTQLSGSWRWEDWLADENFDFQHI